MVSVEEIFEFCSTGASSAGGQLKKEP